MSLQTVKEELCKGLLKKTIDWEQLLFCLCLYSTLHRTKRRIVVRTVLRKFRLFRTNKPIVCLLLTYSLFINCVNVRQTLFCKGVSTKGTFTRRFCARVGLQHYSRTRRLTTKTRNKLPLVLRRIFRNRTKPSIGTFIRVRSNVFVTGLHGHLCCLSIVIAVTPLLKLLKAVDNVVHTFDILGVRSNRTVTVANNINRTLVTATFNLYITVLTLTIRTCFARHLSHVVASVRVYFSTLRAVTRGIKR